MPPSIPFAEPPFINGLPSPYYTPSHLRWQKVCRDFITTTLHSNAIEWERQGHVPEHVFTEFAKAGFLLPNLCPLPVEWCKKAGFDALGPNGEVKLEEFDYIHFLIYTDEMSRSGIGGPPASITTGVAFGLPPIINYGTPELQQRFVSDLLSGKKRTCIAITEPGAGSDVANIETTAVKAPDGKSYIVNGQKKWITNGIWADYATMAVRTGGPGPTGLSLLVVPLKNTPGVQTRHLKVAGLTTSGTTFIDLEDVRVPVENLIGTEGMGMQYIMTNFNHERLSISIGATRQSRVAVSTAFEYVMKREAFGKPLIEQPVVRHRLAKAGALVEQQWAWVEQMAYCMKMLPKAQADRELGGLTALLKASSGIVVDECARCAVLLFGGNGLTKSGQGELVEMIYRDVPGVRVPGGSEDVLLDLAVRELVKNFRRKIQLLEKQNASKL